MTAIVLPLMLIKRIKRIPTSFWYQYCFVSMKLIIKRSQLYVTHKSRYIVKYSVNAIICKSRLPNNNNIVNINIILYNFNYLCFSLV